MKLYWSAALLSVSTVASGSAIGSVGTGRAAAATAFASRKELGAAPTGGEPTWRTGSAAVGGSTAARGSSVRAACRVRMEPRSGAAASRFPSAPMPKRARRVAIIDVWSKGGRVLVVLNAEIVLIVRPCRSGRGLWPRVRRPLRLDIREGGELPVGRVGLEPREARDHFPVRAGLDGVWEVVGCLSRAAYPRELGAADHAASSAG
jgi:hypothetical protein